jgi:hypothetical protein
MHSSSKRSGLGVAWNELDVLNASTLDRCQRLLRCEGCLGAHIRNSNGADDLTAGKIPKSQGVGMLDTSGGLKDSDWDDKVRSEDDVLLPVNREAVWRELLAQDVQDSWHILRPLMDDVEVCVRLHETTGSGADRSYRFSAERLGTGRNATYSPCR